jgi:hypothetical protein
MCVHEEVFLVEPLDVSSVDAFFWCSCNNDGPNDTSDRRQEIFRGLGPLNKKLGVFLRVINPVLIVNTVVEDICCPCVFAIEVEP